jgi:hypothetical protein
LGPNGIFAWDQMEFLLGTKWNFCLGPNGIFAWDQMEFLYGVIIIIIYILNANHYHLHPEYESLSFTVDNFYTVE